MNDIFANNKEDTDDEEESEVILETDLMKFVSWSAGRLS